MSENYVFAVARIRAKERQLLSDADIAQMISMNDPKMIMGLLEEHGWEAGEDGTVDSMIANEEEKTRELMDQLSGENSVVEVLYYPQVYHNLKAAIKEICTEEENAEAFYPHEKYGREQMLAILRDGTYARLPGHMQKAAREAKELMLTTRDGQRCDFMVDRACLEAQELAAGETKDALLANYLESQVAVSNIRIAVRAQKTGRSLQLIQEALCPCKGLDVKVLARAAAEGEENIHSYLSSHGYAEASDALKESFASFERWCDDQLTKTILPQKRGMDTSGPIVAYYLAKQNELKMVRILMTAKANGFPEETITERLRKMYG